MDDWEIGRRAWALRELRGYSREMLAAKLKTNGLSGLSATNLAEFERGYHGFDYGALDAIAYACGVPVEWFTADFSRLGEISGGDPRALVAQLASDRKADLDARRAKRTAARERKLPRGPRRRGRSTKTETPDEDQTAPGEAG